MPRLRRCPAAKLGAHVATLGIAFYTGTMFPSVYRNNAFIAEHGSWNRTSKSGYRVVRVETDGDKVERVTPFLTGFLDGQTTLGRPVAVSIAPDGALLVSDDMQGAIYRIAYTGDSSMKLHSDSFGHGKPIPSTFAMGAPEGFGGNRNPQLAWSDAPDGTRSFALLCIDPDVPTVKSMVGKAGVEIPVDQPRTDFTHWVMADIPADVRAIAEGAWSNGAIAGGKHEPRGPHAARHGLNDYTGWFAGDATMGGDYFGYDGPFPPSNDLRMHRYFFRLFALDVAGLDLPERFGANDALRAMQGHVLVEALTYATYSLHPQQPRMMLDTAWLFWGLVFSSIGFGYFLYGKKQGRAAPLICGIALMIYPYFISNEWAIIVAGRLADGDTPIS